MATSYTNTIYSDSTAPTGTGVFREKLSDGAILSRLRKMGYHLTGSRRILKKYQASLFKLSGALGEYRNVVSLIGQADWDIFADTKIIQNDMPLLVSMGFSTVGYASPYENKMTQLFLRHVCFPIEITGKLDAELYMSVFESLSVDQYIGALWKSNPIFAPVQPGLHKKFISKYYDHRISILAQNLGADPLKYSNIGLEPSRIRSALSR